MVAGRVGAIGEKVAEVHPQADLEQVIGIKKLRSEGLPPARKAKKGESE